jgi:hypothetical protein
VIVVPAAKADLFKYDVQVTITSHSFQATQFFTTYNSFLSLGQRRRFLFGRRKTCQGKRARKHHDALDDQPATDPLEYRLRFRMHVELFVNIPDVKAHRIKA